MKMYFEELLSPEGLDWNAKCSKEIYDEGYVKVGNIGGVYPRSFLHFYPNRIKNFKIRKDDIWTISFPKSGTTWTQEMVWCIANGLDYVGAQVDLEKRFPYFEVRSNWSPMLAEKIKRKFLNDLKGDSDKPEESKAIFVDSFTTVENSASPRFIKSHLHHSFLPDEILTVKPKLIYVARNPKDVCVSFYHHSCLVDGYSGSFDDYVASFVTDNVFCSPYWTHLKEYWGVRYNPNVLFLKYEDMKTDLSSVIHRVANFLEKPLSQTQADELKVHLSFDKMKNNQAVNKEAFTKYMKQLHGSDHDTKFMRKGQIGSWKDEMSEDANKKLDDWITTNGIKDLYV